MPRAKKTVSILWVTDGGLASIASGLASEAEAMKWIRANGEKVQGKEILLARMGPSFSVKVEQVTKVTVG